MVMCRDGGRGAPENRPKMRPETWSGKWRRRRKAARQGTLLGLGEVDVVACVEPVQRGLVLLWAHSGPHFCWPQAARRNRLHCSRRRQAPRPAQSAVLCHFHCGAQDRIVGYASSRDARGSRKEDQKKSGKKKEPHQPKNTAQRAR
eukprot:scaffold17878_cov34-Tisochrysis_lutea.AAC.2